MVRPDYDGIVAAMQAGLLFFSALVHAYSTHTCTMLQVLTCMYSNINNIHFNPTLLMISWFALYPLFITRCWFPFSMIFYFRRVCQFVPSRVNYDIFTFFLILGAFQSIKFCHCRIYITTTIETDRLMDNLKTIPFVGATPKQTLWISKKSNN